jgi:phosphatidate cytidylyltransferase
MLRQRVLTAVVGIPLGLLLVYLGGWYLASALALVAVGGLREYYRLMAARGIGAYAWLGYPLAVVLMAAVAGSPRNQGGGQLLALEGVLLVAAMGVGGAWALSKSIRSGAGSRLFATLVGHLYVPQLLSYVLRLRALDAPAVELRGTDVAVPVGLCWVIALLLVIWGLDTAAFAVGKTMGKHKLCPTISPGKTVEGALGALLAAVILTAGIGFWVRLPIGYGVILGAILGVIGQAGDLFESMLKRRAGVKDSGALLPGHGGVLDRFDSLLFAAPVAYLYLAVLMRW